jgi:hypothetical protein
MEAPVTQEAQEAARRVRYDASAATCKLAEQSIELVHSSGRSTTLDVYTAEFIEASELRSFGVTRHINTFLLSIVDIQFSLVFSSCFDCC